jgi:hypothetical protein
MYEILYAVIWRATNWDKEEAKDRKGGKGQKR